MILLPDPLWFLAMIFPLIVGMAENIGQVCGGGSKAKGTGGPRIGTIGLLLLMYPFPLPLLVLGTFCSLATPWSFDILLAEPVISSIFLSQRFVCTHT